MNGEKWDSIKESITIYYSAVSHGSICPILIAIYLRRTLQTLFKIMQTVIHNFAVSYSALYRQF